MTAEFSEGGAAVADHGGADGHGFLGGGSVEEELGDVGFGGGDV